MVIKFIPKPVGKSVPDTTIKVGGQHPVEHLQVTDFAQNYVKYHVHKNIAGHRKAREHDWVHISDLDPERKWCPREPALLTYHKKKRPDTFLGTAQSVVFEWGHLGADLIIKNLPPEMVWGNWRCINCDLLMDHCFTPACCIGCSAGRHALRYVEVLFRDPKTKVTGSSDLFVDVLGNGMLTGIEIKTEGNDSFGKRSKPTFDHELRTMGYLFLYEASGKAAKYNINTQSGRIIYVTKEGYKPDAQIKEWGLADSAKSPFKEYWVKRNDDMIEGRLAKAMQYRTWRENFDAGVLTPLPDRICKGPTVATAKRCAVRKECFECG